MYPTNGAFFLLAEHTQLLATREGPGLVLLPLWKGRHTVEGPENYPNPVWETPQGPPWRGRIRVRAQPIAVGLRASPGCVVDRASPGISASPECKEQWRQH